MSFLADLLLEGGFRDSTMPFQSPAEDEILLRSTTRLCYKGQGSQIHQLRKVYQHRHRVSRLVFFSLCLILVNLGDAHEACLIDPENHFYEFTIKPVGSRRFCEPPFLYHSNEDTLLNVTTCDNSAQGVFVKNMKWCITLAARKHSKEFPQLKHCECTLNEAVLTTLIKRGRYAHLTTGIEPSDLPTLLSRHVTSDGVAIPRSLSMMQTRQAGAIVVIVVAFIFGLCLSLVALSMCAKQSMRFPFDDISAASIAAKFDRHYDRAGCLGGCLSPTMGWREAAILLSGSGRLPRMLLCSRVLMVLLGLALLPLTIASRVPTTYPAIALLIAHAVLAILWNAFVSLTSLSAFDRGSKTWTQAKVQVLDKLFCPANHAVVMLLIDFLIFVLGSTAGFSAGVTQGNADAITLAASLLSMYMSIVTLLGPCLASHATWMGKDLQHLTPQLERLHLDYEVEQPTRELDIAQSEATTTTNPADTSDAKDMQFTGEQNTNQGFTAIPLTQLHASPPEQPLTDSDVAVASFRSGTAKLAKGPSLRNVLQSDSTFYKQTVAQNLLRVKGKWAIFDHGLRLLGVILAFATSVLFFLTGVQPRTRFNGFLSLCIVLLFTVHICWALKTRYGLTCSKVSGSSLRSKFRRGLSSPQNQAELHKEQTRLEEMVSARSLQHRPILNWRNQTLGKISLSVEGLLLALAAFETVGLCSLDLGSQDRAPDSLLISILLVLTATFTCSYVACFGYAGGEVEVPKDRIANIVARISAHKHISTLNGYVFPVGMARRQGMQVPGAAKATNVDMNPHLLPLPATHEPAICVVEGDVGVSALRKSSHPSNCRDWASFSSDKSAKSYTSSEFVEYNSNISAAAVDIFCHGLDEASSIDLDETIMMVEEDEASKGEGLSRN